MTRYAQCQCGALRAEAEGEPDSVVVCSCLACQRRSGSPIGMGIYFQQENVRFFGAARQYSRPGASGHAIHNFFCPDCGTTLYWTTDRDIGRIGIAAGAFADPSLPKPTRSVYESTKHHWLQFGADIPGFVLGRDSERAR
ncbi:MAG: GFA family protein [Hyphomonadaceae bacterium]